MVGRDYWKKISTFFDIVGLCDSIPNGVVVAQMRIGHESAMETRAEVGEALWIVAAEVEKLLVDGYDLLP